MKKILMFSGLVALLFCAHSQAEEAGRSALTKPRPVTESSEWKPHFGVLFGTSMPERSGIAASEVGIDVGYQPFIPFGLGAEISHARIDNGVEAADRTTVWAKNTYNFGGDIPFIRYTYLGVGLGAVIKTDRTSAAIAPIAGFDIPLRFSEESAKFSLGASSKYAVVSDGDVDTFSLNAVVKYWY